MFQHYAKGYVHYTDFVRQCLVRTLAGTHLPTRVGKEAELIWVADYILKLLFIRRRSPIGVLTELDVE